jgi:tetratricopeptide (TPR) repeat protein
MLIEIDPNQATMHFALGLTLSSLGKYEEAVACYRKAIEIDPKDADYRKRLEYTLDILKKINDLQKKL